MNGACSRVSNACLALLGAATMRNPSELVSCGRRVCDRIASHALDVPLPFVSCLSFRLDSETGVYNKLLDTCGGRWRRPSERPHPSASPHTGACTGAALLVRSSTSSDRSEQCEAAPKLKLHYQCAAFLKYLTDTDHCRVD